MKIPKMTTAQVREVQNKALAGDKEAQALWARLRRRAMKVFAIGLGVPLALLVGAYNIAHWYEAPEQYAERRARAERTFSRPTNETNMPPHFQMCLDRFGNSEAALWCAAPYIEAQKAGRR